MSRRGGGWSAVKALDARVDYLVLATGSSCTYPAKPRAGSGAGVLEDLRRTHEELTGTGRFTPQLGVAGRD